MQNGIKKDATWNGSVLDSTINIATNILSQNHRLADNLLRAWFGNIPNGYLNIWTSEDKASRYFSLPN